MPQAIPVGPLVIYLDDGPPSTSDDSATIRARRGYWWADALAGDFWLCVDPAEGAAVWYRLGNAEDLAAIAWSGDAADLSGTLDDARLSQAVRDNLALADSAIQASDLGSAAYVAVETFDPAGSAAAVGSDLSDHEQDASNPHAVTAEQVGAPPLARTITAGTGLDGGGDLSADLTLNLSQSVLNSLGLADTAVQPGDLAAIATSGQWADLSGTPTTLAGYGITDAATSAQGSLADSAVQPGDLGSAAHEDVTAFDAAGSAAAAETAARGYTDDQIGLLGSAAQEDASAFDPAGSAAAVASDLAMHEQRTDNPHAVTYSQVGADPSGSAAAAESNANSYTDNAIGALGSAAHERVGTQPLELPRNTELGSAAFTPYEPLSLYPITPAAAHILTPDDAGKAVWSGAHDITLPDTAAPGMEAGSWRAWVKNTHSSSSLTIDCAGASDTLDGGASLSLAAGESVLIVMIADGEFGSL